MVCTHNVARSPLFAAALAADASNRLGDGAVRIASAGVRARPGAPAAPGSLAAAAELGLQLDDHRSRNVDEFDLDDVGIVLTMSRAHHASIARRAPQLSEGTFPVRELAALLPTPPMLGRESGNDDGRPTTIDVRRHLAEVALVAHRRRPLVRLAPDLDVPDPVGADPAAFPRLTAEVRALTRVLGVALFSRLAGGEPLPPGPGAR